MNNVTLSGYLSRDPRTKVNEQEPKKTVSRFTLGVNRRRSSKEKSEADFIGCVIFGNVGTFLKKGMHVELRGEIRTGSYEKDGEKKYTTEVYASELNFLEKKDDGNSGQPAGQDGPYNGNNQAQPAPGPNGPYNGNNQRQPAPGPNGPYNGNNQAQPAPGPNGPYNGNNQAQPAPGPNGPYNGNNQAQPAPGPNGPYNGNNQAQPASGPNGPYNGINQGQPAPNNNNPNPYGDGHIPKPNGNGFNNRMQ